MYPLFEKNISPVMENPMLENCPAYMCVNVCNSGIGSNKPPRILILSSDYLSDLSRVLVKQTIKHKKNSMLIIRLTPKNISKKKSLTPKKTKCKNMVLIFSLNPIENVSNWSTV